MQESMPPPAHPVLTYAVQTLSGYVLGAISGLASYFLLRKRTKAETSELKSRETKQYAEARQFDSETIFKAYDRLGEFQDVIEELRIELSNERTRNEELERKREQWKHERRLMDVDNKTMQDEMRKLRMELDTLRKLANTNAKEDC